MNKVLILNMEHLKLEGDILDVTSENAGIIYSLSKEVEEELSVDYVEEESELEKKKYDVCTFFFNLNNVNGGLKKESLIKKITESLKDNGSIYLWDMNKTRGEVVDYKIKVILPNNKIKEGVIKNLNPLISCNFEEIKKILSKYYIIKEEKQWEDVFFLNGVKKKDIKSEDSI